LGGRQHEIPFQQQTKRPHRQSLLDKFVPISIVENCENSPAWMAKILSAWNETVAEKIGAEGLTEERVRREQADRL
jgi:hypothetical protein